MRTGFPYLHAISIMVANCSSRFDPLPTLPGLMRYLASASAHSGYWLSRRCPLKWKSPTSGTAQSRRASSSRMRATCAAASAVLTVIRTNSEPARARSLTCSTVALASAVSVLVMDCTTIGAPPPTRTCPMRTWRVVLRSVLDIGLLERQARDIDLEIRPQIDWRVVVGQPHIGGVANHHFERRCAFDRLFAPGRVELGQQDFAVRLLDSDPGQLVEFELDAF